MYHPSVNSFHPEQARQIVGPDLGPNYSAYDTS